MERFLRLGPKQFFSGIAPSAHSETSGLFWKADGITPLYDAGGTASPDNGLLQAGATPTDFTGSVVVDTIFGGCDTNYSGTPYLYMIGSSGHFYQKGVGSGAPTDLRSGTQITNPANGVTVWGPAGGTTFLYYWQQAQIGKWDLTGTYATGWTDNAYTITQGNNSTLNKPVHQFNGNVYYGNGDLVGALLDNGAGGVTHSSNVLDIPTRQAIITIADDGQYLVIGASGNPAGSNFFCRNVVYFWDTFSASWNKSFEIRDPAIISMKKMGSAVYVQGQYGIYEVTFAGGVKKLLSRLTGFATLSNNSSGFGSNRTCVYNTDAFMFLTDTTIDTLGKLQPDVPNAYLKPFKIPAGIPSFISAGLDNGRVYVGTNTPKLYAFDFNGATHDTGNTAQTVYFNLPVKMELSRVDLIFGEPLASSDSLSLGIFKDEDTAVTTIGSATYAADGATRRRIIPTSLVMEDQFSIKLTYTAGSPKLKYIDFYGKRLSP